MSMSDIIVDPTPDSGAEQGTLARLAALGAQVDRLRQAPEWVAWLRAAAKFHHYSFGNQLLISVQRPDATGWLATARGRSWGATCARGRRR
jgi:hypothetical protein